MWQSSRSSPSGDTAKTIILIGLIFQAVEAAFVLGLALFLLPFPFLGVAVLAIAVVGILWLFLVYAFSYRPTTRRAYSEARTPTLLFGILALVSFSIIPGILYLVAWAKLGDAENELARMPRPTLPPAESRYCPACGRANSMARSTCEDCGGQLS